jgi:hypothetical protein
MNPMRFRDLIRAAENKYNRLLAILIVIYLFSPFLVDWSIGNLIVFFVFLGALIVVIYQIQGSKRMISLYLGLSLTGFLMRVLTYLPLTPLDFTRSFDFLSTLVFLTFLTLSIWIILQELIIAKHVTADLIKGGICIYFLIGFLWVGIYSVVYSLDANSFDAASATIRRADLAHFSFTTLTTVGYGDIAPVSNIARVLANLEGMAGVMYPTTFIARLVSSYSNR